MPLYEYQCRKCGHRFEEIQRFSDPKLTKCPECKGRVERLPSAPSFQFKGSGWYATDYAGKGKESSRSDGDSKSDKAASKDDGKADSKAKSDTKPKSEPKKSGDD